MSFLSRELQKNAKLLQQGAERHIEDLHLHESIVKLISPEIEKFFISKENIDIKTLLPWMRSYFKTEEIAFTAIDGTMFKTTVMDANIFFAGSYESSGLIKFKDTVEIEYTHKYSNKGRGISSVVPLQVAEVIEVDTQFDLDVLRSDYSVQISEDLLLDQSNIAESIMLFSEYYLAYQSIINNKDKFKSQLILLDRSISGDHSALIARTQKQVLWKKTVNLLDYQAKGFENNPVNENDYYWGRWYVSDFMDPIKPYFRFKILKLLLNSSIPVSYNELMLKLQLDRSLRYELIGELKFLERKGFIIHSNKSFILHDNYRYSWSKIKTLVIEIGKRIFQTNIDVLDTKSPFIIKKIQENGEIREKWITTRDLSFLTLFCMYMIIEISQEYDYLVIGLTKDSGAREFRRQFIPIAISQGHINSVPNDIFKLPQSDRSFLQHVSSLNPEKIPWTLTEYDAVFRTIMADGSKVIGAKSNLPGIMMLFSKSYIQLKRAESSHDLQSHVLAMDRILTNRDVTNITNKLKLIFKKSERHPVEYELNVFIGNNDDSGLSIQHAILIILEAMTPHSLPEAFGHNKPLYIADKVAKFYLQEFKRLLTSIGSWITNDKQNKKNQLNKSSFRENRSEIEQNRYLTN